MFKNQLFDKADKIIQCKNDLQFHILNTYDSVGRDLFFDGIYEPLTVNLIRSLLHPGDVMIDAGANIGAVSLQAAYEKDVSVYAFEPGRRIFDMLEKNIRLNEMHHIKALPVALSDTEGILDFYESDRVHGWSGLVKIDSFEKYNVEATPLNAFAVQNGIDRVRVLKADVQGWEYHVFKGAERLLDERRVDHIVFEFEWWAEKNAGLEPGASQQYLLDKGYTITTLQGEKIDRPLREGSLNLHAFFG